MKTKLIFDAFLQEVVPHTLEVDKNGEILAKSTKSDHFVKFPAGTTVPEFTEELTKYHEANIGQVAAVDMTPIIEEGNALIDAVADGEIAAPVEEPTAPAEPAPEETVAEAIAEPAPEQPVG